ncbi:MAG: hypothetical protein QXH27_04385 [Candidatus Micrarchaeia archaeon]
MRRLLPALLLLASLTLADIQVESYSVSPSTLKPGLSATVTVTFANTGDSTVAGIVLVPSGHGFIFSVMTLSVGDISPGGSTVATVPFRVAEDARPGSSSINLNAYWAGGTVSGPTYKLFSIPVTIESPAILQLNDIRVSKRPLVPGEAFNVSATLRNTGGRITDVVVAPSSANFIPQGRTDVVVGTLEGGGEASVSYALTTTVLTSPGTYSLPLLVRYTDALGSQKNATLSIGPIEVAKSAVDFSVEVVGGETSVEPGGRMSLALRITNNGNDVARSASVLVGSAASSAAGSPLFSPLGPSEIFIGDLAVGASKTVSVELGANTAAAPGYYPLSVQLKYSDASGVQQPPVTKGLGIEVAGINAVDAIATTSPAPAVAGGTYTLSVQVSNVGTGPIRAVKASAASPGLVYLSSPEYFIGSLEPDDYGTAQYSVLIKPSTPAGRLPVNVSVEFRNSANALHRVQRTAYIEVIAPEVAAQARGGGQNGWLLAGAAIIILVVLYLTWRRFFGRRAR